MESSPDRPLSEVITLAAVYLTGAAWSVVFVVWPAVAYVSSFDLIVRVSWSSISGLGFLTALVGVISRRDIKIELPGLIFSVIGPLFYFLAQIYFVFGEHPPNAPAIDPSQRTALMVFALLTTLWALPRITRLNYRRHLAQQATRADRELRANLTPSQEAQPGAFPELKDRK